MRKRVVVDLEQDIRSGSTDDNKIVSTRSWTLESCIEQLNNCTTTWVKVCTTSQLLPVTRSSNTPSWFWLAMVVLNRDHAGFLKLSFWSTTLTIGAQLIISNAPGNSVSDRFRSMMPRVQKVDSLKIALCWPWKHLSIVPFIWVQQRTNGVLICGAAISRLIKTLQSYSDHEQQEVVDSVGQGVSVLCKSLTDRMSKVCFTPSLTGISWPTSFFLLPSMVFGHRCNRMLLRVFVKSCSVCLINQESTHQLWLNTSRASCAFVWKRVNHSKFGFRYVLLFKSAPARMVRGSHRSFFL